MKYLFTTFRFLDMNIYTLDASLGSSDISSHILSHRRKIPFRKSTLPLNS